MATSQALTSSQPTAPLSQTASTGAAPLTTPQYLNQQANRALGPQVAVNSVPVYSSVTEDADAGPTKTTTPAPGKFKYDTTTMNSGKINDPLTHEQRTSPDYQKQLDADLKTKYPGGVSFNPPFTPADSPEAADAKNALALSFNPSARSGEQGRCVDLNGTKTLVKADIDKNGKATVSILGPGQPEVPDKAKFATLDDAKKALTTKYGLVIDDSSKPWTKDELQSAYASFDKMSPEEAKALKDVKLRRVVSIPDHPERSGQFSGEVKVGPPATYDKTIQIADSAFSGDKNQFVGDGSPNDRLPASAETFAHEAGHAVEAENGNAKLVASNVASEAYNKQKTDDYDGKSKAYFDKVDGKPVTPQGLIANKAIIAVAEKSEAVKAASTPAQLATAQTALKAAVAARDKALNGLTDGADGNQEAKDLASSQDQLAAKGADFAKANIDFHAAGRFQHHLPDGEHPEAAGYDTVVTKREDAFDAYTKLNHLQAPTDYGATDKKEMYAESFSLYKTNPEFLKQNDPKLYSFFQQQEQKTAF